MWSIFRCVARCPSAITFFSAIGSYVQLQRLCALDLISNCYRLQRNLFNDVIASFIRFIIPSMKNLNSRFQPVVNA
jgi:hypothetical protein